MQQLKIAFKLPAMVIAIALLAGASVGLAAYFSSSATVTQQAEQRLAAAADNAATALAADLAAVGADLTLFAGRADTVSAIDQLAAAMADLRARGDATELLQDAYIVQNPHPAGDKLLLDASGQVPGYDEGHGRVHPGLRSLALSRGYADIVLFDGDLNAVYTVDKQADFGTNFGEGGGPWSASALGAVARAALASPAGTITLSDFEAYGPRAGAPASFMATPVYVEGRSHGVLAIQLPAERIEAVLARVKGLGAGGAVLLVGPDGTVYNSSPLIQGNDAGIPVLQGAVVTAALGGATGLGRVEHADGSIAIAAAEPMAFAGVDWALVALESQAAMAAPVIGLGQTILFVGGVMLVVAVAASLVFARSVMRPVSRLIEAMRDMTQEKFDVVVPGLDRADELGVMAEAVEVFRTNGLKARELQSAELGMSAERAGRVQAIQAVQHDIGQVVAAAIEGDFSRRLEANQADADLRQLAENVNALVASVDEGIQATGTVLAALARADLGPRMGGTYKGAFEQLQADTNAVADRLSQIVGQLRDTSGALKTATGETLSGAQDLSERLARQASTIEQTAAAIDQLSRTVMENASEADIASQQAQVISGDAEASAAVMGEATQAMGRITQSSSKISNIIGLIDDIAFQTNLLALNASVEAARAGDAGKGFAVVAVEVRRLAQSAASASADVKLLIEQSAADVQGGTRLVDDAAQRLTAVQGAIRDNAGLLAALAKASRNQARSIDDVSVAVRQIDEMTQHNAALLEETHGSIEQSQAQAGELDRAIGVFTLHNVPSRTRLLRAG